MSNPMEFITVPINDAQVAPPFEFAMERPQYTYLWIVIFSATLAFLSAIAMGANDVSSSFGTTVGSRALKIREALILSAIFQIIGAYFLGARVVKTVGKSVANLDAFQYRGDLLMIGMTVVLIMTATAVLLATAKGFPISTTQCIISTIVGFALASPGNAVNWPSVITILVAWCIAPILTGVTAASTFVLIRKFILRHPHSLPRSLLLLPLLTWFTIALNLFFVLFVSPIADKAGISIGVGIGICLAVGAVFGIVLFAVRKRLETNILSRAEKKKLAAETGETAVKSVKNAGAGILAGTTNPLHMRKKADSFDAEMGLTKEELGEDDPGRYETSKALLESFAKANQKLGSLDTKTRVTVMHKEIQRILHTFDKKQAGVEVTETTTTTTTTTRTRRMSMEAVTSLVSFEKQQKYFDDAEKNNPQLHQRAEEFDDNAENAFRYLQIFTSIVAAFAQGSNSIGNITGPLSVIVGIYNDGASIKGEMDVQDWVTWLGISGLLTGLFAFGYLVLTSVGVKMIHVSPSRGFSIGFASSLILAIASFVGLPLSTTHCTVGAIAGVGLVEKPFLDESEKDHKLTIFESIKKAPVNWKFIAQVVASWFTTVLIGLAAGSGIYSFATFSPSQIIPMNAQNCVAFYGGAGQNVTAGSITIPADGLIKGIIGFANNTVVPI